MYQLYFFLKKWVVLPNMYNVCFLYLKFPLKQHYSTAYVVWCLMTQYYDSSISPLLSVTQLSFHILGNLINEKNKKPWFHLYLFIAWNSFFRLINLSILAVYFSFSLY